MRSTSTVDQQKFCETHKDQVITFGCSKCWKVYCVYCVSTVTGNCESGEIYVIPHHHIIIVYTAADWMTVLVSKHIKNNSNCALF